MIFYRTCNLSTNTDAKYAAEIKCYTHHVAGNTTVDVLPRVECVPASMLMALIGVVHLDLWILDVEVCVCVCVRERERERLRER